jgi:spermidine synthase
MLPGRADIPRWSIALTSAAALAYELLLMKLFSIIQWHHFAYMIISLALLGYGMSGSFLALFYERLKGAFRGVLVLNILLFALSVPACFLAAQALPFNPLELFLDAKQLLWLLLLYLLLALPFLFAGNVLGLAFTRYREQVGSLYAADLFGAGLGSLGILGLLYLLFPESALKVIAAVGVAAAVAAYSELGFRKRTPVMLLLFLAVVLLLLPRSAVELKPNAYKDLSLSLRMQGARLIDERSSPLGVLSVVENEKVPFRCAPGLSLAAKGELPPQLGVFTNGDGPTPITEFDGALEPLAYLDALTSALPYHLKPVEEVLVVGAGGGSELLQALYHGSGRIEGIEVNPQMAGLVRDSYAGYAGHLYDREEVTLHTEEARSFMTATEKRYDLIQIAMVDSFGASATGVQSLNENYLYTVEAFRLYMSRLKPGGYLAVSRWLNLPPREALKLFATAAEALRQSGTAAPGERLALIRGWQTTTLVVKNGAFTEAELASLERFCTERAFDAAYHPRLDASQTNRYTLLERPYFFEAATALLKDPEAFYRRYKFIIEPATDNRPYFGHFFKWETLPELLGMGSMGGFQLLDRGYLVLVASLLQAVVASLVLILLPLRFMRKGAAEMPRGRVFLYFSALGFGFLFLEIYFIQRFVLFLNHPLTAVAVVLGSFLLFAGFGSGFSKRLLQRCGPRRSLYAAVGAILGLGMAYLLVLNPLFAAAASFPEAAKMAVGIVVVSPLAFAMGMPFPLGVSALSREVIPWAWGINGCTSVIGAVAATLGAIHFGFAAVMVMALGFYLAAALFFSSEVKV